MVQLCTHWADNPAEQHFAVFHQSAAQKWWPHSMSIPSSIILLRVHLWERFCASRLSTRSSSDAYRGFKGVFWHFCWVFFADNTRDLPFPPSLRLPPSSLWHLQVLPMPHFSSKKKKHTKKTWTTIFLTIPAEHQGCQRRHNVFRNLYKTEKKKLNILWMR